MNFKYKCFLQNIFSLFPNSETLNYFFIKYVTKSLPPNNEYFLNKVDVAFQHYQNFLNYNQLQSNGKKYYEFGAGWNLLIPLTISLLDFEVLCVDIRKLAKKELIRDSLNKFMHNEDRLPFELIKLNNIDINRSDILMHLNDKLKFCYYAPADARALPIADNSIDLVSSTATLEHIPEDDILSILRECYRILQIGGVVSLKIDYQDHWSYFDRNISVYNFLKYSSIEWNKFNPSIHYQNRLRHSDYMNLISQTGFKVVCETVVTPNDNDRKAITSIKLADEFSHYQLDDLLIRGSDIVLIK